MKELFIPFNIPRFEEIQSELLLAIDHDYKEKTEPYAFTYPEAYMKEKCPLFMEWLLPRLKLPVRLYRYYVTPPNQNLGIHIDGANPTVPFGLNIPVSGTKNTYHNIYECELSNFVVAPPANNGYLASMYPRNFEKLKLLHSLEITSPQVINNAVMHGVVNNTNLHRIMFTVRWLVHHTKGRNVDECMDTTGMF